MTISSGNFSKLLMPGLYSVWGVKYNDWDKEYPNLVEVTTSKKRYEELVGYSGLGLLSVKAEGAPVTYDTSRQGLVQRSIHNVYSSGFMITREMYDDNQYDSSVLGLKDTKELAKAANQTLETVVANVYNRAQNSSYTFSDGKVLCATDHGNLAGGTWQNRPTNNADLSELAVEQACITIGKWTNDRGMKAKILPQRLVGPVDLQFEMNRLLKTEKQVDTANNTISAIYNMGVFPKGYAVNHYLTDTDAWFIRTDVTDGAILFMRDNVEFANGSDFETENAKFLVRVRFSVTVGDPRTTYGSAGA